jgi:hypothetical protein
VALKLLAPDAGMPDALAEGRLLARLNHPHIVRVFGADTHDGRSGIWMELLEGETLDEIVARDGVFGTVETLLVGLDLARALAAVHAAGLLHRDIKTRNVIRERGGRVVLMDLSASRLLESPPPEGDGAGTPMYMAPELLAGAPATERSDIYSMGVVLYRLLTGSFPVDASDLADLRTAHRTGRRRPLAERRPDLAPDIVAVVERSCRPDPAARYASAVDVEAALAGALQRVLPARVLASSFAGGWWARWRRFTLTAAAMAAALLVTGWGVWDTNSGRSVRRALGQNLPPRSVLYLAMNGSIGIVRGSQLTIAPFNPTLAITMAVSSDLGVRTIANKPPWATGGAFTLDGTPMSVAPVRSHVACCWADGTTDGRFNYAVRQDGTLLDPIGSRPLAPPCVYRFGRDWSHPELLFPLEPDGVYAGVAFSARSGSFWVTRNAPDGGRVEQWSVEGVHLSTPVTLTGAVFTGVAIDPLDDTLWVLNPQGPTIRLENFDAAGRHLGSFIAGEGDRYVGVYGAEFVWATSR